MVIHTWKCHRSLCQQLGERPVESEIPILGEPSLRGFTTDLEALFPQLDSSNYGTSLSRLSLWSHVIATRSPGAEALVHTHHKPELL